MSAQAARRVDPSTIVSTDPGRNYEVEVGGWRHLLDARSHALEDNR